MKNLTKKYLKESCKTIKDYSDICGDLADEMIHHLGCKRVNLLYIEPIDEFNTIQLFYGGEEYNWDYHIAPVIDGLVHDAWSDKILEPKEYLKNSFPGQNLRAVIYCENDVQLTIETMEF